MKIYCLDEEYTAGKHKIVVANYDRDDFAWKNTIGASYSVLTVDELGPDNKAICRALSASVHRLDVDGEQRYFIDADGDLAENIGWEEYVVIPD